MAGARAALLALGLGLVAVACSVEPLDVSDLPCPCGQGYACDRTRDRCVAILTDAAVPELDAGPPDDGLSLWFPFDDPEIAGIADRSGNGRDATCEIDTTCPTRVIGRFGGAALFDGPEQHLRVSDDGALSGEGAFSLAMFLRPSQLTRGAALVKLRSAGETSFAVEIDAVGRVAFTTSAAAGEEARAYSDVAALRVGVWTHVAVTVGSSGAFSLYVDGEVAVSGDAAIGAGGGDLLVSGDGDRSTTLSFPGALDDVRYYGRELSAEDVARLAATMGS